MTVNRKRRVQSAGRAPAGRPAQRRRTRKAIVDATIALLAHGRKPSVADVAAAADVSRRTVFLYFPTFDQLLLDATIGALSEPSVDRAIAPAASDENVEDRVERLVRAVQRMSPAVEQLGRTLIRLTVDSGAPAAGQVASRRGFRRLQWIESALAPLRPRLDAVRWRRLVAALAMVVGWEALIAQRDVCGLGPTEGEELSVWAARALLRATLEDVDGAGRRGRAARRR